MDDWSQPFHAMGTKFPVTHIGLSPNLAHAPDSLYVRYP